MEFAKLCAYFEELENVSSRLKMMEILAGLFKSLDEKSEIDKIIYLSQGRLAPAFDKLEFGISEKLINRALALAAASEETRVKKVFQELGDYGLAAEKLITHKSKGLTVSAVHKELETVAGLSGEGSVADKIEHLSGLLGKASPLEAKYILRIILGRLRLGVGDSTILDSLSFAYADSKSLRPQLERAYNLCSDLGLVARTLFVHGLKAIDKFEVRVGHPIRVALAERLSSPEEIIEKIGRCSVEGKYDGFRCQVHKNNQEVKIYSRNLEDTTAMFPEIAAGINKQVAEKQVILEGEAIAYDPKTGAFLPFQVTVQRKRKHGITEMQKRFPLQLLSFDLLFLNGIDYTKKSYVERREKLKQIIKEGEVLKVAAAEVVDEAEKLEDFFEQALNQGLEGIVAKRLDAPYQAGGRNFTWIKLKKSYQAKLTDTVDCVLVGYLSGKGQRAQLGVGSLLGAVYDQKEERFKTIAKIGSGLSEEEWVKLRQMLDKTRLSHKPKNLDTVMEVDVWVEPRYVVAVQADEITKSPVHTCGKANDHPGYALRFPRMVGFIRRDKNPEDATRVEEIIKMYKQQGGKKE